MREISKNEGLRVPGLLGEGRSYYTTPEKLRAARRAYPRLWAKIEAAQQAGQTKRAQRLLQQLLLQWEMNRGGGR